MIWCSCSGTIISEFARQYRDQAFRNSSGSLAIFAAIRRRRGDRQLDFSVPSVTVVRCEYDLFSMGVKSAQAQ
jgi:hypothetical protein